MSAERTQIIFEAEVENLERLEVEHVESGKELGHVFPAGARLQIGDSVPRKVVVPHHTGRKSLKDRRGCPPGRRDHYG